MNEVKFLKTDSDGTYFVINPDSSIEDKIKAGCYVLRRESLAPSRFYLTQREAISTKSKELCGDLDIIDRVLTSFEKSDKNKVVN